MQTPNIINYKQLDTVENIATPFKIQKEIGENLDNMNTEQKKQLIKIYHLIRKSLK